jgi:plasmid replication initiation protein
VEGLSGIAVSKKMNFQLSVAHLLQSLIKGKFLNQLIGEWNEYKNKGKIKDDYQTTEQHIECLQEILDFIDSDLPDEKRFSVLKKIFLVTATESISERNDVLPQQYMKISRKLTSGEVLVLFGAFHFSKKKEINLTGIVAKTWLGNIANFTNLKHSELIELHEKNLIDKKLITPRRRGEKGSVLLGQHYRLTELGYQICIFVENYDEIYEAEQAD